MTDRLTRIFRRKKMYNPIPKRLNWEQAEKMPHREVTQVVKGTSKRVIVVKSPDPRIFEQAIFIVRDDVFKSGVGEHSRILSQARQVADDYISSCISKPRRSPSPFSCVTFAAVGAGAVGLLCLILYLTGIL